MALGHGPTVVTNGLVLALDAADINSFDKYENLALNSESINSWANNGNAISISANSQIAPDGTLTADVLSQTAVTGASRWVSSTTRTYTAGVTYTLSIWLKKISGTDAQPTINLWVNGGTQQSVGTITTEWVRYSKSFTPVSTISSNTFTGLDIGWNTNGVANNFTFAAWGFQLEVGSTATDYYRTTGTAKNRGSTIIDLSGNGNTGTLTNGPTFNSANGGQIICDGTNDYIEVTIRNTALEFQPLQPFSVFCWVYNLTGSASGGGIISNMVGSSPYPGWDLWINNTTEIAAHIISSWSSNATKVAITFDYTANANKWVNIGYTYNGTSPANATDALNSVNFYVNGILTTSGKRNDSSTDGFNTTAETTTYDISQRLRIGSRWSSGAWTQGTPLTISNTSIYNKALTAAEVQQNFNALRGRFGV